MKIKWTFLFAFLFVIPAFSQLENDDVFEFKISMDETGLYTVFWKPNVDMDNYVIGSGQIAFSAPTGNFEVTDLTNYTGIWNENVDTISSPEYAIDKDYFFIGLLNGEPYLPVKKEEEVVLVTFRNAKNCVGVIELLHGEDPVFVYFDSLHSTCPNCSWGNNPKLDLSTFDLDQQKVYNVGGIYDVGAANCNTLFTTEIFGYTPEPFSIYPNPASHVMKIQIPTPSNEDISIQLMDISGQLIKTAVLYKGNRSTMLAIENIQAGAYLIRYYGRDYQATKKVMILKN